MNSNTQTITICKCPNGDWKQNVKLLNIDFWTGVEGGKPYLQVIDYQYEKCKTVLFTDISLFKLYYEKAITHYDVEQDDLFSSYIQSNAFNQNIDFDIASYFSHDGEEGFDEMKDKTLEWIIAMMKNVVPNVGCADAGP